jgi:hypothetical protein
VFLILDEGNATSQQGVTISWLGRNGFRASHEWTGNIQVLAFGTVPGLPAATPTVRAGAILGEQVKLVGYALPAGSWSPGDIMPLSLFWQRVSPIEDDYSVFVHLLDKSGQIRTQADGSAVGGSRPTSGWRDGELIVDRHGLLLPDDLTAGEYHLLVGMYSPQTGERLLAQGADGKELGDAVPLETVSVVSP